MWNFFVLVLSSWMINWVIRSEINGGASHSAYDVDGSSLFLLKLAAALHGGSDRKRCFTLALQNLACDAVVYSTWGKPWVYIFPDPCNVIPPRSINIKQSVEIFWRWQSIYPDKRDILLFLNSMYNYQWPHSKLVPAVTLVLSCAINEHFITKKNLLKKSCSSSTILSHKLCRLYGS